MIWEPVLAKFKELFGDEGEIGVYFAPGRVNMIGEHTDYQRRTCISMCAHDRYLRCGEKKRRQEASLLFHEF